MDKVVHFFKYFKIHLLFQIFPAREDPFSIEQSLNGFEIVWINLNWFLKSIEHHLTRSTGTVPWDPHVSAPPPLFWVATPTRPWPVCPSRCRPAAAPGRRAGPLLPLLNVAPPSRTQPSPVLAHAQASSASYPELTGRCASPLNLPNLLSARRFFLLVGCRCQSSTEP
jgi:hypothetical protein